MTRTALPLVGDTGTGSFQTCRLKCGFDCWHDEPNRSGNKTFESVVERAITRRSVLKGGLAGAFLAATATVAAPTAAEAKTKQARGGGAATRDSLGFNAIEPSTADDVIAAAGHAWNLVIRWGDPIIKDAPQWAPGNQTAANQERQFGYNCDYLAYLPMKTGKGNGRGLLWANHEYTNGYLMFPDYNASAPSKEHVDIELAAHGGSIVEVVRGKGRNASYRYTQSKLNRRITAKTPMQITGPAAGDPRMRTTDDPAGTRVLGTLNNCGGGVTPWGTVLSAEENFNQYFANGSAVTDPEQKALNARYGIPAGPSERRWERYYDRFDAAKEPHEVNRFGWVVEIDPFDPTFTPRKRTALGRLKHEGAETSLAQDGRVVAYMGDDQAGDYVYKFVSAQAMRRNDRAHNRTLLDSGTLYVAKFNDDGSGDWIPLIAGQGALSGWSPADIALKTRLAADAVGATKMDRPEDIQRNPVTGVVYAAMTNNRSKRFVNAANPRVPNRFGHVIEWREAGNDAGAERFTWSLFLVCGEPSDPSTYFAGFPRDRVSPISAPDNLEFDSLGNLWIATDGQPSSIAKNDALHGVPVAGAERGHVQQFLSVPRGAECTGPLITGDGATVFVSVQHPGEDGTLENPQSTWPDRTNYPRPSVVSVWKTAKGDPRLGS